MRAGYRTTTISTTKVTTTYSDGTEVVSYEASVSIEETEEVFSGRIDQIETLDEMTAGLYRTLNHTPSRGGESRIRFFANGGLGWSDSQRGYHGSSTVTGGGVEYDVTDNWVVGVHVNQISTEANESGGSGTKDGNHVGVFSFVHGDDWTLRTNGGYVWNEYSVDRSVGPFSNSFNTSGEEWWVNNRVYWHPFGQGIENGISPFIGHTVQSTSVSGYSERGSEVTAREVGSTSSIVHSGEVGVVAQVRFGGENDDVVGLELEASVDTEQRFDTVASLDFNETIVFEGFYQVSHNTTNAGVSANVQFTF